MHPETSFFTKGDKLEWNGSYTIINSCYVQYIPPHPRPQSHDNSDLKQTRPILFIHGGGFTSAVWEVTPDRRLGWAALAAGEQFCRPVFLLDTVDHGRSQRAPDAARQGDVEYRTPLQMWGRFRFGPPDGFESRKAFEDGQFPLDHLDSLVSMQAARRRTGDELELRGLVAAIKEIGTCDIISHSHGVALAVKALDSDEQARRLVRKVVLVEPGSTTELPTSELPPALVVWGDYIREHEGWKDTMAYLGGLKAEVWDLPLLAIKGNSHFPMCDRNSHQIGDMVLRWLNTS